MAQLMVFIDIPDANYVLLCKMMDKHTSPKSDLIFTDGDVIVPEKYVKKAILPEGSFVFQLIGVRP